MQQAFQAVQVTDRVYWVGAIDWAIRDFHGYATTRGTTYNAFLVLAEKVTLIDTVKAPYFDEMMARIASVVDPSKIEIVVSNHAEMDHSGCLPRVIEAVRPAKVVASKMGVKALQEHFHLTTPIDAVETGSTLSLGNMTLSFVETRMLHWPDSMVSYLAEEQVLFSQDAFGMHLASVERFDDQLDPGIMEHEAKKYYANIITLYSGFVAKTLPAIDAFPAPIKMVLPDHGPIWRKDFGFIRKLYGQWCEQKPTNKVVVTFDTMWGSTSSLARAIADGVTATGATVTVMPLSSNHRSDVATELLDAGALVVGSPTLNNQMFPTVADVLCYLKGLKFANKIGAAFGSFGWSGESTKQIRAALEEMKVTIVGEPVSVKFVPDAAAMQAARALGVQVGEELMKKVRS
jgi:flavorubredoxin